LILTEQRLELDSETRRALAFDRLLELVGGYTRTALGRRRVEDLAPLADEAAIKHELALLGEVMAARAGGERLQEGELPDPSAVLTILRVEGAVLEPRPLRDLAESLCAASNLRATLGKLDNAEFPLLQQLAGGIPDLEALALELLDGIDPEGRLEDAASPELARIRRAQARVSERLQRLLLSLLRRPDAEATVQDDFVTQRNGRMVIPLRTDAPKKIRGIVHAASSSGATQFVEPLESVELNNQRVQLAEEETQEEERILRRWSDALRGRREEVVSAVELVARLDVLCARSRFADDFGAVLPRVGGAAAVLEVVRHPLLEAQLREHGGQSVPLNLELDPWDRILVLSGPNAGGKTVALKTLGLSVLMTQAAIPVPARAVTLPLYGQVRADIGDHQSIQANLSTFSAHVGAVAGFLENLQPPALLLFDEIGSGTEPGEGAALAQGILDDLRRPGITAVATTHHEALKAWSVVSEGVVTAAMEFDAETLQPTYRLRLGMAGVSAGLEIAAKLGIPAPIIDAARALQGSDRSQTEAYTRRLRELVHEQEQRQARIADREAELADESERRAARASQAAERRAREGARKLDEVLREFREAASRELADLEVDRERALAQRARAERRVRAQRDRAQERLSPGEPAVEAAWVPAGKLEPGLEVRVRSLGREGRVVRAGEDRVEVQLGRLSVGVERGDLLVRRGGVERAPRPSPSARVTTPMPEREPSSELRLIGSRVADALPRLDRFLDDAVRFGFETVRVIHGHGTGRLRDAVREHLSGHPQVERQRPGGAHEGGDGATCVTLRA
jgi:DNA mismatch repair protein MutS2